MKYFLFIYLCLTTIVMANQNNSSSISTNNLELLSTNVSNSHELILTEEEQEWLDNHKEITVLNEVDWPPYDFDVDGEASGYSIEYIKELAKIIGINLVFKKGSWNELLNQFENHKIDLIHVFAKTKEREKKYLYTKPYLTPKQAIAIRKDSDINDIKDLDNKTVASLANGTLTKLFKKQYPNVQVKEYDNIKDMLNALAFNKVDGVLNDLASSYYLIRKEKLTNLKIGLEVSLGHKDKDPNYYLAVQNDNPHLRSILNKALDALPQKTINDLDDKWFGIQSKKIKLTKKEKLWLNSNHSIRYVYDSDWKPLEWKNDLGNQAGIISDFMKIISSRSGIEFTQTSSKNWSKAINRVKNREADMFSGIGETKERAEYLTFSKKVLFSTPYVFVCRNGEDYIDGFSDITNKKIAIIKDSTIAGILKHYKPEFEPSLVNEQENGFNQLRDGEIDIFLVNAASARYYINILGYDNIHITYKTIYNLDLKIAVRKDLPEELISIINKSIDTISDIEIDDIVHKWTNITVTNKTDWVFIGKILGVILVIILFILWNNKKLKSMVKEQTADILSLQLAQKELLDSFIKLIAAAIDAKSKYTGGHCERVPELALMIVNAANDSNDPAFKSFNINSKEELEELTIASWLHDCGKVVTPEYVVDKATKLETIYNRIHEIRTRFEVIHRDKTIQYLEKILNGFDSKEAELWLQNEHQRLIDEFEVVAKANVGTEFMSDKDIERIKNIASQTWTRNFDDTIGLAHEEKKRVLSEKSTTPQIECLISDKDRHLIPREHFDYEEYEKMGFKTKVPEHLYNLGELYNLSIKAGTLTNEERFKIQEHAQMTLIMLEKLPFPKGLKNVPMYAGAHHETLISTGYPRNLNADNMPIPSRIMAIADVFEALTASDRPYKEPKTLSASIKILSFMVKDQHLDSDIFKLFLSSGVYREYAKKYLKAEQIDDIEICQYL